MVCQKSDNHNIKKKISFYAGSKFMDNTNCMVFAGLRTNQLFIESCLSCNMLW